MHRPFHARHASPAGTLLVAALVAGCGSSAATLAPTTAPSATAGTEPAAETGGPSPARATASAASPTPAPAASSGVRTVPGFSAPVGTATDPAWTSLAFAPIPQDDPLASVVSEARWAGGYVALGPELSNHDGTARTPVWTSADGATWMPLDPAALGASTVVLAVGRLGDGVVAVTVIGDTTDCGDEDDCYSASPPLQAWTSPDGTTWTPHSVPGLVAQASAVTPRVAIGDGGIVAVTVDDATGSAASTWSNDGVTWSDLEPSPFGGGAQVARVGALGRGFVALGDTGGDDPSGRAWTALDGQSWVEYPLHDPNKSKGVPVSASIAARGSDGLVAETDVQEAPGTGTWWITADGAAWNRVRDYAPLGVWHGEGEGSGLIPDGTVDGDGERVLALRRNGGTTAWLSTDGMRWHDLPIHGLPATATDAWPEFTLRVFARGVLVDDGEGHAFYGIPNG